MRVAVAELEAGDAQSLMAFYRGRLTDCTFLNESDHYERPRVEWILSKVHGGRLLEAGCGNGGMTQLLAPRVEHLVALDISTPSLAALTALGLPNVDVVEGLIEDYNPARLFDCIVMSEVLEHLRRPAEIVARCVGWLAPGGKLLVTTPNGHWESNEHLQEFTLDSVAAVLALGGAEAITAEHLRDTKGRRRWLVGQATVAAQPAILDDFNDRRVIARIRRAR